MSERATRIDEIVRARGWCGLRVRLPANLKTRKSERRLCMEIAGHDGQHHDPVSMYSWTDELTEEEQAVPMEVLGVGMVDPRTRIQTPAVPYLPEGATPLPGLTPLFEHHGIDMDGRMAYAMPAEPTKQRPGDQVLPTGDESLVDDQQLVIDDLEARRQVGIERYGQGHRPFNGRDTLEDLYEEQLDLLVYLRSIKRMAEASKEDVIDVISKELQKNGLQPIVCDAMAEQVYIRIQGWVAANIMKESNA